ncbi:MAG: dienelactone hydrolase family protein [Anaerolineaceae bacterium]|nr:dienelactone hydrolase family protein [Anaerolineaceae bacterium]
MSNFLVRPKTTPRGGILVIHAWWGLNDFTKTFCKRLSKEGYIVLAPDLYDGGIAKDIREAEKLRGKMRGETASRQILDGLDQLKRVTGKPAGLIGFSLGAYWSLWLVEERPADIAATVMFYGTRGGKYEKTKSAFLGHFAENDPFVSESGRKKLEKTLSSGGSGTTFHVYPETHHWFFEKDRPEYRAEAARLAWKRTLDFLRTWSG